MKKALFLGVLSSLFFAVTFLLNHSMNLSGGYWMWGACLRYLFMLPMLALVLLVLPGSRFAPVLGAIRKDTAGWLLWSTVGFGLFYLPLCLASVFGESWLVAASWEVTIVISVLLTPLFGVRVPLKNLLLTLMILLGIGLLQLPNLSGNDLRGNCLALIPILIAATSYPLGNRMMMRICPPEIDTIQRVFGMTLCSMPFWLVTAVIALLRAGLPGRGQVIQSGVVALSSGVIATILFFHATDLVRSSPRQLAIIEATQCGEVIFTLIGGVLLLGDSLPNAAGFVGLGLILLGMVLNSLATEG